MQIVTKPMSVSTLQEIASHSYGNLVKAVTDVNHEILIIDGILHADLEQFLLDQGSAQKDLWGINLHPSNFGTDNFIEYDSMINLRPKQDNFSRSVEDPILRKKITEIVSKLFKT